MLGARLEKRRNGEKLAGAMYQKGPATSMCQPGHDGFLSFNGNELGLRNGQLGTAFAISLKLSANGR